MMKQGLFLVMAVVVLMAGNGCRSTLEQSIPEETAAEFLARYEADFARLEKDVALAEWAAATTGSQEDFDELTRAKLALRTYHRDPVKYEAIKYFLDRPLQMAPLTARALTVTLLRFEANQLPADLLGAMVALSTRIEKALNTYRADLDGKTCTNNDLLELLAKETDSAKRKMYWEGLKQVGGVIAADIVKLAKLRNQAAQTLGHPNYWVMKVKQQEFGPDELVGIFEELKQVTDGPFKAMKAELDGELAGKFNVDPAAMRPWHYDNPFFQAAPPSAALDPDEFYREKPREAIVSMAEAFFKDIGLPIDTIVERSDFYERAGKDQHAFCTSIDRAGDVRTLLNIKPTANWMDVMLHEQGHAVYDLHIRRGLPFSLREPAHIFATEGVAMLFGALAQNPSFLVAYAGANPARVDQVKDALLAQRRREQLIFARWTMVMLFFEKALYEDPDRDLNTLWWDYVEKYQMVKRPAGRNAPDWAAKAHFTIAPVYYHNYMLGELFAAQLRHVFADMTLHEGSTATLSFNGKRLFGRFLLDRVFQPGSSLRWPEFVEAVTGESFTARYFAREVR